MTFSLNLTAALVAASTYATQVLAGEALLMRSSDVLYRSYSEIAEVNAPTLLRRQNNNNANLPVVNAANSTGDASMALNPDGSINVAAWNNATDNACTQSLARLPQSTNPSGTCVCYNLPSLNTKTGVFEADLRLYAVSAPRGTWASIAPEDIEVGISFTGASVSPVKADEMNGMGMVGNVSGFAKREDNSGPEMLEQYMFVGQIDKERMTNNMTMAALEALLMPILTLSARNSTGSQLNTNISLNEASFLTGVFSREVVMSDFGAAQAAVDVQLAGLANGTVAFVLPGVELMIFPIGLIITSIWLVIGLAAYGYGTFQRMNYAEMYKRRQAVPMNRMKATI